MRIAVIGAGGVGGYFGGRLAAAGTDVTFVARGAHLAAMRSRGLRIISPLGDATIENPQAVDDVGKLGEVDLIMVAVKLWDTENVAATLKPLAQRGATVVSFQNGIDKDDVGPALRFPPNPRRQPVVHVFGDYRHPFGNIPFALMVVDEKMRRFERGPREGGVKFGEGGGTQKNDQNERGAHQPSHNHLPAA